MNDAELPRHSSPTRLAEEHGQNPVILDTARSDSAIVISTTTSNVVEEKIHIERELHRRLSQLDTLPHTARPRCNSVVPGSSKKGLISLLRPSIAKNKVEPSETQDNEFNLMETGKSRKLDSSQKQMDKEMAQVRFQYAIIQMNLCFDASWCFFD